MVEKSFELPSIQQISMVEKDDQPSRLNCTDHTQISAIGEQHERVGEILMMQGRERSGLNKEDVVRFERKIQTQTRGAVKTNETVILPKSEDTTAFLQSLFGNEYTEESTGARTIRQSGGKDRHSKVFTSKGPRDRRVRLSVSTAIQFYDVQDRLGFDQPSKAVEWLIKKAKSAIDDLAQLPNLSLKRIKTAHHQIPNSRGCSNSYSCSQEMPTSFGRVKLAGNHKPAFLLANNETCEERTNLDVASNPDQILQGVHADYWDQFEMCRRHQVLPSSLLEQERDKAPAFDIRASSSSSVHAQYIPQDCFYGNSSAVQTGATIANKMSRLKSYETSVKKTGAINCSATSSLEQRYCEDSSDFVPKILAVNPSQNWVQDQLLHNPVDELPIVDAAVAKSSQNQLSARGKIHVQSFQFPEAHFDQQFPTREQNNACYLKSLDTLLPSEHCSFRDTLNSEGIRWSESRKPSPMHQRYLSNPLITAIPKMPNQQNGDGQEQYSSVKNVVGSQNTTVTQTPFAVSSYMMPTDSSIPSLYNEYNEALPIGYGRGDDHVSFMLRIPERIHGFESSGEKPGGKVA